MEKIITVLLCLLLCSCNYKSAACYKYDGNNEIEVYIEAVNDDIESIKITEVFELPYDLLANEREFLNIYNHFQTNPMVNQIETHLYFNQKKMHNFLIMFLVFES